MEEALLQLQKRKPFLQRLLFRLSAFESNQFGRLFPEFIKLQTSSKNIDRESDQVNKKIVQKKPIELESSSVVSAEFFNDSTKDKELLFKSLYFLEDDQILSRLRANQPHIAKRVEAYTSLSPYFPFRELSPLRWREMVYEFTFNHYGEEKLKTNSQYDRELLNYLKKNYNEINWESLLTTVHQSLENTEGQKSELFPEHMAKLLKISLSEPKKGSGINTIITNEDSTITGVIEIKVSNAGLILFWPFLTRFFEHLSLLKDGSFIDERCRNEAVYLLQYLAYAEIDFPEHQLVLNKVLVGMLPQEIVVPLSQISEEVKRTAQSLLNGLIDNWDKVKNSSPQAIQETFLQREGLLFIKEESLLLKIDKKGVDALITSIPWNISLLKLPWMKKPLHVEWV